MMKRTHRAVREECTCHERQSIQIGHYLGVSLLIIVVSTLWMGVSGRTKEVHIVPVLQTYDRALMLIIGGILAAWNPKAKQDGKMTVEGGQDGPGSKVEVSEVPPQEPTKRTELLEEEDA